MGPLDGGGSRPTGSGAALVEVPIDPLLDQRDGRIRGDLVEDGERGAASGPGVEQRLHQSRTHDDAVVEEKGSVPAWLRFQGKFRRSGISGALILTFTPSPPGATGPLPVRECPCRTSTPPPPGSWSGTRSSASFSEPDCSARNAPVACSPGTIQDCHVSAQDRPRRRARRCLRGNGPRRAPPRPRPRPQEASRSRRRRLSRRRPRQAEELCPGRDAGDRAVRIATGCRLVAAIPGAVPSAVPLADRPSSRMGTVTSPGLRDRSARLSAMPGRGARGLLHPRTPDHPPHPRSPHPARHPGLRPRCSRRGLSSSFPDLQPFFSRNQNPHLSGSGAAHARTRTRRAIPTRPRRAPGPWPRRPRS